MTDKIFVLRGKTDSLLFNIETLKSVRLSNENLRQLIESTYVGTCGDKMKRMNKIMAELENADLTGILKESYKPIFSPTIVLSHACNYRCTYCFESDYIKSGRINPEQISNIEVFNDQYALHYGIEKKYEGIAVVGGEPFLPENRKTIMSIHEHWHDQRFQYTTNGTNILQYADILKKAKSVKLKVSLDGTPEIHFDKRKTEARQLYDRTIEGLRWAISEKIDTTVISIFQPEFVDSYSEYFDMMERMGWRSVSNLHLAFILKMDSGCDDITLLWTPTILVISERASIKLKERDREILLLSDDLLGKIKILISSLEDIRINRLSGSLYSQFELESKRVLQAAMERDWVQIKSSSVVSLVRCIGNITFVIAGYALILTKHISVAQFIQTASLAGQLMAVAITVASAPAAMEPQTVHIMRLYQVINGLCCKKKENTCASIKMRPDGIAGDEITLKYGERTIFKNASFRTKKHGITAVIGENGRGKTSLFRIITGEMQISSGKITFYEEENALTIDEEDRSQYISVAQQIPTIYRATVIENLRLSEEGKECGDKQIKNLCKKVGVYDDIIRLPMGFDTYLSPNIKLSAGQKSKLQIVRCILRNKPIIMLDEPFANLDVTSKKQVADVLKEYANENVVLIATHDSIGGEIATQIIDINDMEDQGELKD